MAVVVWVLLAVVVLAALLGLVGMRRRRRAGSKPTHLLDPSTVRPDVYVNGQQVPDRRREPRPTPRTPGLRHEEQVEDRGAVAFVPRRTDGPGAEAPATAHASSPEELGLDMTARSIPPVEPLPPIESLPPEREPGH